MFHAAFFSYFLFRYRYLWADFVRNFFPVQFIFCCCLMFLLLCFLRSSSPFCVQETGWMSNRGRQNVASFLVKARLYFSKYGYIVWSHRDIALGWGCLLLLEVASVADSELGRIRNEVLMFPSSFEKNAWDYFFKKSGIFFTVSDFFLKMNTLVHSSKCQCNIENQRKFLFF
jgi:hypothetical protein